MSGLFGVVSERNQEKIPNLLDEMAVNMSHQPWYCTETLVIPGNSNIGLGRVSIGIFNTESQSTKNSKPGVTVFFTGEIYNSADLNRSLSEKVNYVGSESDIQLITALYREFGIDFVKSIQGAFFLVVFDAPNQQLYLANDRFGLYPHYYYYQNKNLLFSPEVKGILSAPFVPRKLDVTSACEFIRFQQILGEKTFHTDICLFPYGSIAHYDLIAGEFGVRRYWNWDQIPYRPDITFNEAVEEVGSLFENIVRRLSTGNLKTGVFLSGGLDSRSILGLIPHNERPPISATFGNRNSRDVIYASQISRAVGSQHFWFDIPDGQMVLQNIDLHLKLTEGFHSWIHMHGIGMLPELRGVMDCNLTGWDGGTVMGHSDHINAIYNYPVDEWTVFLRTYHQFRESYTWPCLTDAEERLLFTPEFGKHAIGRAFESMMAEFSNFWQFRHEYAAEYFYIVNHCWRMTHHMITTCRSAVEVRFPYWDYELIDFLYSLQPQLRKDQMMFRTMITRKLPHLARIPYDKNEFLPSVKPYQYYPQMLAVRLLKRLNLFPNRQTLYADYENYLRSDLRTWAETILFDERTVSRGIFNPDFVRSLMNRHLAGHENWILGKIAPLITFEMVMREFFD